MNRLKANSEILDVLTKYLNDNPEIRFGQALYNLRIIDNAITDNGIYINRSIIREEPEETLRKINQ